MANKIDLLVVDDNRVNVDLMVHILGHERYIFTKAYDGLDAINKSKEKDFACVILDVRMPNIDGFEVARRLRVDEGTKLVPIIFITAEPAMRDQLFEGYALGAVEYLLKPFHSMVIRTKVKVFADLFEQRMEIVKSSQLVENLYEEMSSFHEEFRRLTWIASHNLKEPIRKLRSFFDLHLDNLAQVEQQIDLEILACMEECIEDELKTIETFRNLTAVSSKEISPTLFDIAPILKHKIEGLRDIVELRKIEVFLPEKTEIEADKNQFEVLLDELISNAFLHTGSQSFELRLKANRLDENIYLEIGNTNSSLDPEKHKSAFQPMKKSSSFTSKNNFGMGLTIAKQVVRNHKGKIWIESEDNYFAVCILI